MNRRLAWSSFLFIAVVSAVMSAEPAWSAPDGGGSIPGFSKLEDKATDAENQVARLAYVACSILFIVGMLQAARGNGMGMAMVVGSIVATVAIACRDQIMQWAQS